MKQNAFYDSLSAFGRFTVWRLLSAVMILIVLGINTFVPAFSQSSSSAELHVKDIQIQGNQLIPSEVILRVLKTEKGDICGSQSDK
jgi:outer membrane protein assembly factor BamA